MVSSFCSRAAGPEGLLLVEGKDVLDPSGASGCRSRLLVGGGESSGAGRLDIACNLRGRDETMKGLMI